MRALPLVLIAAFIVGPPACGPHPEPARSGDACASCTLIQNVRLFDGERVTERTSVLVRNGLVAEVGPRVEPPRGSAIADGSGRTLLPGLIDSHVHVWDASHLEAGMRFGVTTMLDMMTDWREAANLKKEALRRPELADLRSAGTPVTARGGHGTEYGLVFPTLERQEDADAFIKDRVKEGSDYVKIIYTPDSPFFRSISRDTLKASSEAAHREHLLAVVHVETLRGATDALEAGADGLVHLFYDTAATQELVDMARSRGAFIVPTLSVLRTVAGKPHGPELAADAAIAPKLGEAELRSLEGKLPFHPRTDEAGIALSIQSLRAAGVPLLAGTDAPNPGTSHGVSLHGELELLVAAGLTPVEVLASATSAPARAFGLRDRGRVASGLRADLLLVDGDPTRDIRATRRIAGVWKQGVRLPEKLLAGKPSEPIATPAAKVDPPKTSVGIISDFESDPVSSRFGLGWSLSTDAILGGTSIASMARVAAKARAGSSLRVSGEVAAGAPVAWSGVMFNPGDKVFSPVNLSSGKELIFWCHGDGRQVAVLLFTQQRGRMPSRHAFVARPDWKQYRIPLSAFDGSDGSDVLGIAFVAGPSPGKFAFELDDVELR